MKFNWFYCDEVHLKKNRLNAEVTYSKQKFEKNDLHNETKYRFDLYRSRDYPQLIKVKLI